MLTPDYTSTSAKTDRIALSRGARTHLSVPMLKDGELVGAIVIYRQEVRPFTDKQIELVQNFAAQAVIAIENTRLLSELRERWSSRPRRPRCSGHQLFARRAGAVFQAMLEKRRRICEAEFGVLYRCEGDALRAVAMHGAPQAYVEERRRNPLSAPHRRPRSDVRWRQNSRFRSLTS